MNDESSIYSTLYAAGLNDYYQLNTMTNHSNYYFPQKVLCDYKIKKLIPMYQSTFFMTDDDKVYSFGKNNNGNGMLPGGGIARFYGTTEVHTEEGDIREKVWSTMHPKERDRIVPWAHHRPDGKKKRISPHEKRGPGCQPRRRHRGLKRLAKIVLAGRAPRDHGASCRPGSFK